MRHKIVTSCDAVSSAPVDVPRYRSREGAAAYRTKYARSFLRRISSGREVAIVRRLLARAGPARRLLDCPCGAGRLLPALRGAAERVTAADLSPEMIREAHGAGRAAFVQASAFRLPFADRAFDVTVCHRLVHHIPAESRAAVLAELARVTARALVLSFADAGTRRARRTTRRVCVGAAALAQEARAAGLFLEESVRIGGWFSVQAVALFRVV
jgi:ubiquinone/menaquinone biosynthesis C-methylase UbiE